MRYGNVLVAGATLVAACGGHTRSSPSELMNLGGSIAEAGSVSEPGPSSAGRGGDAASAGGAPTLAGSGPVLAGAASVDEPHDCRDDATSSGCRSGISLTLRLDQRTQQDDTWAEPLEIPDFSGAHHDPPPALTSLPPPDEWNRALPPAGACLLRVQDSAPACLGRDTGIALGDCDDSDRGLPFSSYYQTPWCEAAIAPGCPAPEAWPSDAAGAWWYVVQETAAPSAGTQLLVICPQLCVLIHERGSACLTRRPLAF